MCGRFFLSKSGAEMARHFDLAEEPILAPRFNIAPTQPVLLVRQKSHVPPTAPAVPRSEPQASGDVHQARARQSNDSDLQLLPRSEPTASGEAHQARVRSSNHPLLEQRTWGFVPHFATDLRSGPHPINARCETVATTPLFRDAFARRRGLVPASGFYEWQHRGRSSRPFAIRVRGGELFAMAALYDHWEAADDSFDSCAIVTSAANERVAAIHDRMPVILAPADYALWLDPDVRDVEVLLPLLRPCPAEWIELHPVERRVNDVRNDDAYLAEPEHDLFSNLGGSTS